MIGFGVRFIGFLICALLLVSTANATSMKKPPAPTQEQSQNQQQSQEQSQSANSSSDASNGDQVSMNSSQFYALSLMFPEGGGCFTGVQGGGHEDNKGGFLGIRFLSTSCWLNQIASTERDIELNARLLCGDRKYRNAVAYDVPRRDRQDVCVRMKTESGKAQVAEWKQALDDAIGGNKELIDKQGEVLRGEIAEAEDRLKERDRRIHEAGVQK
jgi:hypothetical protein